MPFYTDRILHFDVERRICAEYIGMITPNSGEMHILDWDYRQQEQGNSVSKRDISSLEVEHARVQREIDQCKEELDDLGQEQGVRHSQIKRLAELARPVARDTTYIFTEKYPPSSHASSNAKNSNANNNSAITAPPTPNDKKEDNTLDTNDKDFIRNVIRNVKTGDVASLERGINEESSKALLYIKQLNIAVKDAESAIARQRKLIIADSSKVVRQQAEKLISETDKLDYECYLAVSELLKLRLKIMAAQREEVEELEKLQHDKRVFLSRENQTKNQLINEMQLMKKRLKMELATSTDDFRHQLDSLQRRIDAMNAKKKTTEEEIVQASGNTEKYARALTAARDRYEKLKSRNALEMEGYNTEAIQLRKKLIKLKKLLKLE